MSVYKEGFHAVELIKKNSRKIWNDAADFGAPVKKGDEVWNWTKQLVDWYGVEGSRKEERYATGVTVKNRVSLLNEWTDGGEVMYEVTYVSVSNNKNLDGYVYLIRVK